MEAKSQILARVLIRGLRINETSGKAPISKEQRRIVTRWNECISVHMFLYLRAGKIK